MSNDGISRDIYREKGDLRGLKFSSKIERYIEGCLSSAELEGQEHGVPEVAKLRSYLGSPL